MTRHLMTLRAQWHDLTGRPFRDDCLLIGNAVLWGLVLVNLAAQVLP